MLLNAVNNSIIVQLKSEKLCGDCTALNGVFQGVNISGNKYNEIWKHTNVNRVEQLMNLFDTCETSAILRTLILISAQHAKVA